MGMTVDEDSLGTDPFIAVKITSVTGIAFRVAVLITCM